MWTPFLCSGTFIAYILIEVDENSVVLKPPLGDLERHPESRLKGKGFRKNTVQVVADGFKTTVFCSSAFQVDNPFGYKEKLRILPKKADNQAGMTNLRMNVACW
ncbi:MAG: hypothetical protein AB1442_00290 [Nitrospirota bacterium]